MKYRKLGKEGPEISEIGLGCWQLGGDWGNPISEEAGMNILSEAVNQGITFFDTADVYGQGKSESLIGKFLKSHNKPVKVATKFGRGNDVYPNRYSEKELFKSIEGSLKRLGVNSLDLLQLHCIPQEILEEGSIFKWLRKSKDSGLIKNFGASIETIEQGMICMQQEDLLSLQVIFNVLRQRAITELFPKALETGTGIIVRLPLASGLLSGKFDKGTTFTDSDHRNYNKNGEAFYVGETFSGLAFEKGLQFTEYLKEVYPKSEMSLAQFSLRWILDHEAVSTVIPGASRVKQVLSNSLTSDLDHLPEGLHKKVGVFYKNEVDQLIRGVY